MGDLASSAPAQPAGCGLQGPASSLPSPQPPLLRLPATPQPQAFLWFGVLEQWAPARPGQASQCGVSSTLLRAL